MDSVTSGPDSQLRFILCSCKRFTERYASLALILRPHTPEPCLMFRKRLSAGTVPVNKKHLTDTVSANKEHLTGTVPVNKEHLTGTLSNVRKCWLAMPLGAGFLRWVLACRTIEKKTKV